MTAWETPMYLGDAHLYAVDSSLREQVWSWAEQTNIRIAYSGTDFGLDIWRVDDHRHGALFALRWIS